jgi:hypothetical protein
MWLTSDTTAALVRARNDNHTLSSVKTNEPKPAGGADITGTLEALAAVIPTGIAATYTAGVLIIRGLALAIGTDDRAAKAAALAKAGQSPAKIRHTLDGLPLESDKYLWARVLLLIVGLVAAAFVAWSSAREGNGESEKKRGHVIAEPLTAGIAFVGWSLASPGTPLAAEYSSDDVLVLTVVIAMVAALILGATGKVVLTKPAKTT